MVVTPPAAPSPQGSATVAQVAAEVGYASEAAFSRAFKKVVGMPPAAWRRRRSPGQATVGPRSAATTPAPMPIPR